MLDGTSSGTFRAALRRKHFPRWYEFLPLLGIALVPLLGQSYYALATQILIYIIFAISLDLLIGYAGIVTIGHATFFGLGAYTSGIISAAGFGEPLTGLIAGAIVAGMVGLLLGAIILRAGGFTLVMLTLAFAFLAGEIANRWVSVTGGADGLNGVSTWPVLGLLEFDFAGRTAFYYSAAVLVIAWAAARHFIHSPAGQSIVAIRESEQRAVFIGASTRARKIAFFGAACGLAGLAGALESQVSNYVGLKMITFDLSAEILVMLALGGTGRLYGAFIGPTIYLIAQDLLAKKNPEFWQFWLGILIIAVVLRGRGGLVDVLARLSRQRVWR